MTAGNGPDGPSLERAAPQAPTRVLNGGRPGGGRPPGWKVGLALVSLALSLLLWLNGLVDSLNRPSVGGDLNLRQLELAVLAEPQLPAALRPLLAGRDPARALEEALAAQIQSRAEDGKPAPLELQLERVLLLQRLGRTSEAETLRSALPADDSPELRDAAAQRPLLRLLMCEARSGTDAQACAASAASAGRRAMGQLLAVTLLPALVLLLGVGLLLRELWLLWRRRLPRPPAVEGPPLSGLDAVLLIAGGFVVLGELLTPLLVAPLLQAVLEGLAITSPLREGISVVVLYLALMAGPLLILALMLAGLGARPAEGWLLFRWRPLMAALRPALRLLLMVLPLVSLVGWLQGQIWGDPGGSNPLLDLVLRSHDPAALACFGITAVVLAPLFEETIFRGVLLPVAARELGAGWGVLVSAAVFAVAHLSLGELPPLFMLGLGLGWLRWSGGRLGSCVLMHALWNGLTFTNLVLLGS
ncbi:MAG: CPBP family intramembrane glutamic endopeptidase [Vulcanococcus sp.]